MIRFSALIVTLAMVTASHLMGLAMGAREGRKKRDRRPNILLVLTDDQDVVLGGMDHMPLLQRHLVQQGTSFRNFFVHTPICCPSRASILTGRYIHNVPIKTNRVEDNCYGQHWQKNAQRHTFAVYAQKAGYRTGYAGKYLNPYGRPQKGYNGCITGREDACILVPPGWDHWMANVGNSKFYNYTAVFSDRNGTKPIVRRYGDTYKKDYLPYLVARRTIRSMRQFVKGDAPFLLVASYPAPHTPCISAPQDVGKLAGLKAPRTPNWNTTDE